MYCPFNSTEIIKMKPHFSYLKNAVVAPATTVFIKPETEPTRKVIYMTSFSQSPHATKYRYLINAVTKNILTILMWINTVITWTNKIFHLRLRITSSIASPNSKALHHMINIYLSAFLIQGHARIENARESRRHYQHLITVKKTYKSKDITSKPNKFKILCGTLNPHLENQLPNFTEITQSQTVHQGTRSA